MVRNKLCWKANKGVEEKPGWTGKSSFVLKVPLRYLSPSIIYSVACDHIVQRAYCSLLHVNSINIALYRVRYHTNYESFLQSGSL